jgi:hypothetical protein
MMPMDGAEAQTMPSTFPSLARLDFACLDCGKIYGSKQACGVSRFQKSPLSFSSVSETQYKHRYPPQPNIALPTIGSSQTGQ